MIMGVGEPAERGAYRQPGHDIDLRIRRTAYRVQDNAAPVVDLLEAGVASFVSDRIQRHTEPDRHAGFLVYLPYRTYRHGLAGFDFPFGKRPIVIAPPMNDHDFGAAPRIFPSNHSAAGEDGTETAQHACWCWWRLLEALNGYFAAAARRRLVALIKYSCISSKG